MNRKQLTGARSYERGDEKLASPRGAGNDVGLPLARIDLIAGQSTDFRRELGEVVYEAMLQTLKVLADDRF